MLPTLLTSLTLVLGQVEPIPPAAMPLPPTTQPSRTAAVVQATAQSAAHTYNSTLRFRPEIGYYRNWTNPAFDLGTKNGMWMAGFDFTVRFSGSVNNT